jgi:hypothetical protein
MRDEEFQLFIDEFGEATSRQPVPESVFRKFDGKLPAQLLSYWQQEGFASYGNGLFWITNPDAYENIMDEWLHDTKFEQVDIFHVVARSAFGKLFLWGEKTGASVKIACPLNAIFCLPKNLNKVISDPDDEIRSFFVTKDVSENGFQTNDGEELFPLALERLGPLTPNEIYGFEPALVAGGSPVIENIRKVNLQVHLSILREMAAPTDPMAGVDVDALMRDG